MIDFKFDEATKCLHCSLQGRMDVTGAESAGRELDVKLLEIRRASAGVGREVDTTSSRAAPSEIVFEMSGVDFVSSAFIRLCMTAAANVPKGGFSIAGTRPPVMKVFKIAGIDHLIKVS